MGRRVVKRYPGNMITDGKSVVKGKNKYSSLNNKVKLFKEEILYLTVYNNNYNNNNMQGNSGEIRQI
jgi:hypothetical protein